MEGAFGEDLGPVLAPRIIGQGTRKNDRRPKDQRQKTNLCSTHDHSPSAQIGAIIGEAGVRRFDPAQTLMMDLELTYSR
jgi:hypothetical protein